VGDDDDVLRQQVICSGSDWSVESPSLDDVDDDDDDADDDVWRPASLLYSTSVSASTLTFTSAQPLVVTAEALR